MSPALSFLPLFALHVIIGATPIITQYNKTAVLYEGTQINQVVSTIECSDPDGDLTNTRVLSVSPSSPCANCFEVLDCGVAECLQYRAGVGTLDHGTAGSYLITLACEDNMETPATEVVEVIVAPSSPPYFDPDVHFGEFRVAVDTNLDASLFASGDLVYDVNATDNEGDDVFYTLGVTPASASTAFSINAFSGEITALASLESLCLSSVTLEVTITDGTSTPEPLVINAVLTNSRVAPVAINLNRVVQIPEDTTGAVYVMRFVDGDGDALTYSVTSSNTAGFAQYTLNGAQLEVSSNLHYEASSLRTTELTVTASDAYCTSEQYSLTLEVTDVNEAPSLSPNLTTVFTCEGQIEFESGITVVDPDTTDTHKWTLVSSNPDGYYSINPETGVLGTSMDYDVDLDYHKTAAYPLSYDYVIKVRDKGGLTATATVTASFLDCNDNSPRFLQSAYSAAATECTTPGMFATLILYTTPGTILLNLEAEDADSARQSNNDTYFTGSRGAISVGSDGAVTLLSTYPAGTVVTFPAYVWDKGQTPGALRSENPAYISIRFLPCPPTVAPVTPAPTTAAAATTTATTTTSSMNISEAVCWASAAWVCSPSCSGVTGVCAHKFVGNALSPHTGEFVGNGYSDSRLGNALTGEFVGNVYSDSRLRNAFSPHTGEFVADVYNNSRLGNAFSPHTGEFVGNAYSESRLGNALSPLTGEFVGNAYSDSRLGNAFSPHTGGFVGNAYSDSRLRNVFSPHTGSTEKDHENTLAEHLHQFLLQRGYPNDDIHGQPDHKQLPTPGDMEVHGTNTVDPVITTEPEAAVSPSLPPKNYCIIL
ncbi:LOW QUALITY PROTEIN: protocadherin fat 4 [Plakobranchus ocellatus]|uniref:Protocadherin fat 4 n=1 Tax=Plakobranchus ocellatus TaxID=259542 RepID=A0AAV4DMI3_9GAST|nr:LOW QUALITY PROTEIN: protocadherin fat 4 [Plakobranchus ocellatus]